MKKKRCFSHLDQIKRDRLEALWQAGHKQKDIAKILKVDKSTVSREINGRKKKNGVYDAETAQHKARVKRLCSKYQGMKIEENKEFKNIVIEELEKFRSPDEISGRLRRETGQVVGKDAIYKWLYSNRGQRYCHLLCSKRYKKKKQDRLPQREMIKGITPLFLRPNVENYNHGEGDTLVSPKRFQTSVSIFAVCEKSSQLLWGNKTTNLKPATIAKTAKMIVGKLNLDTLTLDRGQENRDHFDMNINTYACDAHSPWQKPHIECNFGLLRRWFIPKKTDLRKISDIRLQEYFHILNSKYRKSLGYKNAYEVALERGIIKTLPKLLSEKVAFEGRI